LHKKRKILIYILPILLVIMTVAAGCGGDISHDEASLDNAESPVIQVNPKNREKAQWTYLVYMAADNDLEATAWQDINKMEQIGSTADVNIVVQWDNRGQYGSPGCRRYLITKNPTGEVGNISSQIVGDLGEINSANPEQLVNFVKWGIKKYPAEKYAIILWNHGAGWREPTGIDLERRRGRGICFDQSSNDFMSAGELNQALEEIYRNLGRKIDFVGMDACLMGMTEIAYNLKDHCRYITFSESSIYGWPYHYILGDLTADPTIEGRKLCQSTVVRFGQYWTEMGEEYYTTISAVDTGQVDELALSMDRFVMAVKNSEMPNDKIKEAANETESIDAIFTDFKDLNLFMHNIIQKVEDPDVRESAVDVQEHIKKTVIFESHGGQFSTHTAGLTIWLPEKTRYEQFIGNYLSLPFCQFTRWNEVLEKMEI